jgi:hypothetical protein
LSAGFCRIESQHSEGCTRDWSIHEKRKLEAETNEWVQGVENEIKLANEKAIKLFEDAKARFADKPDAIAAFAYYEASLNRKQEPEAELAKPLEVEIIPPQRRLEPAPIERMMVEVVAPKVFEPEVVAPEPRCKHGNLDWSCCQLSYG